MNRPLLIALGTVTALVFTIAGLLATCSGAAAAVTWAAREFGVTTVALVAAAATGAILAHAAHVWAEARRRRP